MAVVLVASCSGDSAATTTTTPTTTTIPVETTFTLPGSETESVFTAGDMVGVIGAAHDVTHWLISFPGGLGGVERELLPTQTGLEAVGTAWQVDDMFWERLRLGDREGYFPRSMLGYIGEPEDVTSLFNALSAESVESLGEAIAGEIEAAEIVLVGSSPLEVVYDVLGLGDDSVAGYRIRVLAIEDSDGFVAELVQRTPLCARGWDDESGRCS